MAVTLSNKPGLDCGDRWLARLPAVPPRLEHDGLPAGLEVDNASVTDRRYDPTVREKVFNQPRPANNQTSKNKKKKKKTKKSNKNDSAEKIPSPNSSLEASYNEATQKAISFVKSLGFTDQEIHVACSQLQGKPISQDALLDMAYRVQGELISLSSMSISPSSSSSVSSSLSNSSSSENVSSKSNKLQTDCHLSDGDDADDDGDDMSSDSCDDVSSDEDRDRSYRRAVEREKMRYRDLIDDLTITCRVCNCSRATILLLPCGHLVCCDDCLMDVRRCPISRCNKVVRGTKEVFFA